MSASDVTVVELAKLAYQAYSKHFSHTRKSPMPQWDYLIGRTKEAWVAVCRAVVEGASLVAPEEFRAPVEGEHVATIFEQDRLTVPHSECETINED